MKFKKLIKKREFILLEIGMFSLLLGIPFFVSGKGWLEYLNSLTVGNVILMIIGTFFIGYIVEKYGRKLFK